MIDQYQFIHEYNMASRPRFNPYFFERSDDDLIRALRDVIYSCERQAAFTIKVLDFEVIEGYDDVNHILWEYEESIINKNKTSQEIQKQAAKAKPSSSKKKVNQFAYINLKDSDLKIIKVTYYIEITEKKDGLVNDTITVYIAIPRIIDGFYFRLNGNMYSAMYQVVDASTYNNSAAKNAKKQSVTFKSIFMATRLYRYSTKLTDIEGRKVNTTYFVINIFTKSTLAIKYLLARFGWYETMNFLHLRNIFVVRDLRGIDASQCYVFPVKKAYYIIVPRIEFDDNKVCQSFVYTIHHILNHISEAEFNDIFGLDLYLYLLGSEFTTKDTNKFHDKGLNILRSLEFIYDDITRNDLHLSDYDKADIYRVIRWMMYEFTALRQKDNLDISTKKIRYAEYLASYYATKLAFGIYRISDRGADADLDTMRKALQIPPMFLINKIIKCQLVNYKNCVNDIDSLIALKYTYKGVAGIGQKQNAISNQYRSIHPSHLGRVDIDSSSNSDPGTSGTIIPMARMYDGHFSEYEEPSSWRERVDVILDQYKAMRSKQSMYRLISSVNPKQDSKQAEIVQNDCAEAARILLNTSLALMQSAIENGESEPVESIGLDGSLGILFGR